MYEAAALRLRDHFRELTPRLDVLAQSFYGRLFDRHPELRRLYPSDMAVQRGYLATALALVIRHLDRPALLEQPLRALGRRHVSYGVRPHHYPPVRDALLFALAEVSGPGWSDRLRRDWADALDLVIETMLAGAEGDARAA